MLAQPSRPPFWPPGCASQSGPGHIPSLLTNIPWLPTIRRTTNPAFKASGIWPGPDSLTPSLLSPVLQLLCSVLCSQLCQTFFLSPASVYAALSAAKTFTFLTHLTTSSKIPLKDCHLLREDFPNLQALSLPPTALVLGTVFILPDF